MDTKERPAIVDRSTPGSLFYLPDELLVEVVSHLAGDAPTLCNLARTCRFFQIEAEKHIYTTIALLSTDDLRAIIEAFTRRPQRIASVETLKILYRFDDGLGATVEERAVFNRCVAGMKALRSWHIESPYDNYKWDDGGDEWVLGDMEEFRRALESASLKDEQGTLATPADVGLAKLEKLTIHTHGVTDDFWTLGNYHCLFRHPSLRYLHVSCLALPVDLPLLGPYAKSTPLTDLIFDECELEPKSLGRILATPKNLRRLTLGENVYNMNEGRRANPRLTRAPEAALAALKHVAHSLESLTHYDPSWRLSVNYHKHNPITGDGMRDFHTLKTLWVDACSFLHRSIALSHTQAPPNLATLHVRHPRPRLSRFGFQGASTHEDFFERLPPYEPYTYLPSLKTLDFVQGASLDMPIVSPRHICEDESFRERHSTAFKLHKHGINMTVTLEATWRQTLIPPVLHNEPAPELICMYDSSALGFRRQYPLQETDPVAHTEDSGDHTEAERLKQEGFVRLTPPTPETDELSEGDILEYRRQVTRSINMLWNRMRSASDDSDDDEFGPHMFTLMIDPDHDMWDDIDNDDDGFLSDELDIEWHDAEEGEEGEYELDMDEIEMDDPFIEAQAQALLHAAAVVAEQEDEGFAVLMDDEGDLD